MSTHGSTAPAIGHARRRRAPPLPQSTRRSNLCERRGRDIAVRALDHVERLRFLNGLRGNCPRSGWPDLDAASGCPMPHSEVLFAWLALAIPNRYEPAIPAAERFLTSMGRRKFAAPLFEALLAQGEWGRPIAERIYAKARPTYHPVTSGTIDKLMAGES